MFLMDAMVTQLIQVMEGSGHFINAISCVNMLPFDEQLVIVV